MSKQIIILENDRGLADSLVRIFAERNWQAQTAATLRSAYHLVADSENDFQIAVIDRVLDDGDGLDFVSYLAEMYPQIKVICLTQKKEVMERIKGLRAGADDYLPKPFATQELLLKIEKLLKTQKMSDAACHHYRALQFYPENGQVLTPEGKIQLRRREAQILTCLMKHQENVVTRKMLIDSIWPGESLLPLLTTLDVYVRRLRMALPPQHQYIKTIRGFGYMLRA